ncbi:ABC transporter ATP-binding protein [Shouchella lonarensis]|uniref:Iron complex transport system ATP-binding protein n=1 Tax=Shouchella lonarensis TaxID=1464122 RepID=A0A1G6MHG9_9BACI|nr:ABC transporter ATP-binding protein [Shouchella lonarensis]SDC54973.1 iron complex transport system ATP-binding protein [Shouchella lonarensis]
MTTAIETEHLTFRNGYFTLRDLNLTIPKGKVTAIVGPNGSGKSTLLHLITKLLKQTSGDVRVENMSTAKLATKSLAKRLAMMPQCKQSLPSMTVKELVSFGRAPYQKWYQTGASNGDRDIVDWALQVTNTKKHANRMFDTLSGGEQQKVRIALALAQQSPILLLDEPTTYLDIAHQLEMMDMLKSMNKRFGLTIVMVLHELQQAAAYCDHLVALKEGHIAATGQPQQVLTARFLKEVYHIDAKVVFSEGYPLIIPLTQSYCHLEAVKTI